MNKKIIVLIPCLLFVVAVCCLPFAYSKPTFQSESGNKLKVLVSDLEGNPLKNATVTIKETGQTFLCDNQGRSPLFEIDTLNNPYGNFDWFTITLLVQKEGYVNAVVIGCVIYQNQTRLLKVQMYPSDQSDLPFVCLVESPPSSFLNSLFEQNQ